MPKHNASVARKSLAILRKTEKIRKMKPHWVAAFATQTIERSEHSVIISTKFAKAKNDITKYGITKDYAENSKDKVNGYAWFEDGIAWLSVQLGSFAKARIAMQAYFKKMKVSIPPIKQGKDLSPEEINKVESEDENTILALGETPDTYKGVNEIAAKAETEDEFPELDDDVSPRTLQQEAPTPNSEKILSEKEVQRARESTEKIANILNSSLARIMKDKLPDPEALAGSLSERLNMHLAALAEPQRAALMETGPCRLLMEASRAAVLNWGERDDIDDRLNLYAADFPVHGEEVVNGYVDIATRVLHEAEKTCNVSRTSIEQRVAGVFNDDAAAEEKFNAIGRLTKGLLPVIADADRLEQLFGVTPVKGIEDVHPATLGIGEIYAALPQAVSQIDACRNAYEEGLSQIQGEDMTPDDHAFFDNLIADLSGETNTFLNKAQTLAKQIERGANVPQTDKIEVRLAATTLRARILELVQGIDGDRFSPTSIAGLYTKPIDNFLTHLPVVA